MTRARVIASPNLRANGEIADALLSPRVLMREAAKLNSELALCIRPARIRKLVADFVRHGRTDVDLRTYLLTYADPTGELACRHVMRELREQ